MMTKIKIITTSLFFLLCLVLLAQLSLAAEFTSDDNIHISNLHRLDDDLYGWGSNITIDGLIEGDLSVGGYTVNINGQIKNSANIFAYKIHHTGKVGGTFRGFANSSIIDGYVGRSLMLFSNEIKIGKDAFIEKEVYLFGSMIYFDGTSNENVEIRGENIYITGIINGDLTIHGNNINILAPAIIKGNFNYISDKEADIEMDEGVTIVGETSWEIPEKESNDLKSNLRLTSFIFTLSKFLAALLFGLILMYIAKKYTLETVYQLRKRFIISAATGLLALLIFIFSLIILIISVTCVVAGLALISGDMAPLGTIILVLSILLVPITSFATVSGGVIFYSGKIVIALLLGYFIIKLFKPQVSHISKTQLALGLIILVAIFSIPYIGFALYLVVSIIGAGGIILGIRNCRHENIKNNISDDNAYFDENNKRNDDTSNRPNPKNPPLPEPPHSTKDDNN